jgi:hypothetical protein
VEHVEMPPSRIKKPELERSRPIRTFDGLFGRSRPQGASGGNASRGDGSPGGSTVTNAVDLGYRIIDEYMRQGQAFARSAWSPGPAGDPLDVEPQQLAERMYQYASDFAGTWVEYVQAMMARAPSPFAPPGPTAPPPPGANIGGFDIGHDDSSPQGSVAREPRTDEETGRPTAPRVSIDLASKRRTEITVDLRPGFARTPMFAHDLRARDSSIPRISGIAVNVDPSEDVVTIRIRVPDDQPPAVYSGLLVDEATNLPRGTVSIRICV